MVLWSSPVSTKRRLASPGTTTRIAAMHTAATVGRATSSKSRSIRDTWQVTNPVASPRCTKSAGPFIRCWRAGQIEGGSSQGLGYALLEEVVMQDGRMANAQLTNYIIPTTLDTPPMTVVDARKTVHARAVWSEGCRRDANRWPGAGGDQRASRTRASMSARFRRRRKRSWRLDRAGRAGGAGRAGKARRATCNSPSTASGRASTRIR